MHSIILREKKKRLGILFQVPSHAEAFEPLDIAFKWFERQDESDSVQL